MIRLLYVCAYAAFTALGFAAVARPAILWVRSQVTGPAWDVPFGPVFVASSVMGALLAAWLAGEIARRRNPGARLHLALLLAVALCFTLRRTAADPTPRAVPDPAADLRYPGSWRPARSSR